MGRILLIAGALLALASPGRAYLPEPPAMHNPATARCAVEKFISAVNRHDLSTIASTKIIADDLGGVTESNLERFFASFDVGTKLSDQDPLSIRDFAVLELDGVGPIYLASIVRRKGKDRYWAVWLFKFHSDEIVLARRADELWPLLERGNFGFGPCRN